MDAQPRILTLYAQLEAAHRQALDRARLGNWDEAAAIGGTAQSIISKLTALEAGATLSAAGLREKKERIERTLGLVTELRGLAEPARAETAAQLSENALRGRISNSYGV
ncbi:MAG: flagellar protein FliT [Rhodocyclales bacterium]|nr:flagellar protein FliT [Rhodocyclales bacterium]